MFDKYSAKLTKRSKESQELLTTTSRWSGKSHLFLFMFGTFQTGPTLVSVLIPTI